jgi:single-stranded-DNA-specific exonuclease
MYIVTHGDCDGICSGAITLYANKGANVLFSNPVELKDALERLSKNGDLIICDIALNNVTFEPLMNLLRSFS